MKKSVLILGVDGMVGQTVYRYFRQKSACNTYGTTRNTIKEEVLFFDAFNATRDFTTIMHKIKHVDYVINCVGIIDTSGPIDSLIFCNALLPHTLETLAKEYDFKLLHISTDAVFSKAVKTVCETDMPSPNDAYGASKLLGETFSNYALTIRTSFLGLSPQKHTGLLEWVNTYNKKEISGFTNHLWSGCTTLQFAQFCNEIIANNTFHLYRKLTPVLHFAPIKKTSKYHILKYYIAITKKNVLVKKKKTVPVTRILTSHFFDIIKTKNYTGEITLALKELLSFEKK